MLEVRIGTVASGVKTVNVNPKERYFWDLTYIDAPIAMEFDTNTDGTRDNQLFATWDLSDNVDRLVTAAVKIQNSLTRRRLACTIVKLGRR